jgi:hypothetical protein
MSRESPQRNSQSGISIILPSRHLGNFVARRWHPVILDPPAIPAKLQKDTLRNRCPFFNEVRLSSPLRDASRGIVNTLIA